MLTACVKSTLQHAVLANPLRDDADILNCFVKIAIVIIFAAPFPIGTGIKAVTRRIDGQPSDPYYGSSQGSRQEFETGICP
jgi:hypothetical protein